MPDYICCSDCYQKGKEVTIREANAAQDAPKLPKSKTHTIVCADCATEFTCPRMGRPPLRCKPCRDDATETAGQTTMAQVGR